MRTLLPLLLALCLAAGARAQFDFGKLSKGMDTLKSVGKVAKAAAKIGPAEERVIGDSVALELVGRYGGLVRDEEIMRRVNLIGRALGRYSSRPELDWRFGVLDSATVNAFSAPDGYVFITRGLYRQADTDDALAAILGHEIAHITKRHALSIVERGEFLSGATSLAAQQSGRVRQLESQLRQFDLGVEQILATLCAQGFDPLSEYDADQEGRRLAFTTGYAAGGLRGVLRTLAQQGGDPRQIFSTHPPLQERIQRLSD